MQNSLITYHSSLITKRRKIMRLYNNFQLFVLLLFLAGCSGTRHLPKGEKLYVGAATALVTDEIVDSRQIKSVAQEAVRPEPNSSVLGMRPKLWLYQTAGENPKGKVKQWLKKKGESPVLLSDVKPAVTAAIIDAKLFNLGIFNSKTTFETKEKERTAKIIYTSHIHAPYKIKSYSIEISDDSISRLIKSQAGNSLVKAGDPYQLVNLQNERNRIDALLKDSGYFYFSPDYLVFEADTSVTDQGMTLRLTLKKETPDEALRAYCIRKVTIDQNYSLDEGKNDNDTTMYGNVVFMGKKDEMNIRPDVILRAVFLKQNENYDRQNHSITLNRLMSMGNFKFVQVKFADSDSTGYLDVTILLTPLPTNTFRAEMDIVTKSNNYTGPRMNISLLNRNTFGGSEQLNLNMAGSFEAQLNALNQGLFSYSFNPQLELTIPRLQLPFKLKLSNSIYTPQTRVTLSYNYMKRVNYFDMSTLLFSYGYKWKKNVREAHELTPINISNTALSNESDDFKALLTANPYLKKSYDEQFVAGASYSYTYNEQPVPGKTLQYYLQFHAESAGSVFSLINIIAGKDPSSVNPSTMLGMVYSQFVKFSVDGRAYININSRDKLAMRFNAGIGKAFGNSSSLPYSRQFFSGGPNSIRAFAINSVGPGDYEQQAAGGFLQTGGDIKLEMNAEYRFDIYSFLKGAVFVDAGNVWLQASNPVSLGNPFRFNSFMNEVAVGSGFGLRLDVSFFVLRFDLAAPLRKPWLPATDRWVINEMNPFNADWRKENLMLNMAIGYPF
jgi:outer membrane protein insertion porin family